MGEHIVCRVDNLPPDSVEIVNVENREIGVFNVDGEFYALNNICPHRGGPLCEGRITGFFQGPSPGEFKVKRENQIIQCPWHGWEFDITNGELIVDPKRLRTPTYDVSVRTVDDDDLIEAEFDDDLPVETYSVSIEEDLVILHI